MSKETKNKKPAAAKKISLIDKFEAAAGIKKVIPGNNKKPATPLPVINIPTDFKDHKERKSFIIKEMKKHGSKNYIRAIIHNANSKK